MDHRLPLKPGTVLAFDGMPCHMEEAVGCGSNAIVYKGWYPDRLNPDQRHHVLVKELFPFHPQGKIWREETGEIAWEPEAQELFEMHRQSFLVGNEVHLRLLADHPEYVGANLNSFSLGNTLYSVLGYTGGRSLQAELAGSGRQDLRCHVLRMLGLLDALEAFHKSGFLHLDISPDNIMLVGQGDGERIFLIDYNSARPVDSGEGVYISFKTGYSAPEVETNDVEGIGFSSDLYSVTAVFYRCLMGKELTLEQMLRSRAPDGQESVCLADMPQTVKSLVGRILKKGLHTLPRKRYQTTGQLRQDLRELLDRIDCVGVTHWALWENGRRSVEERIRVNPSLRYLTEGNLYPIRLEQDGGMTLEQFLERTMSAQGQSGLILAQGGMGKTTLLLHTALLQGKRYSPAAPAVFYVSLSGWHPGDTHYIRGELLRSLRFKREMNTYDSAMHALEQLLRQPLKTKNGEVPVILLLIDGLNELRGDIGPAAQEIRELADMAGVRLVAASRSPLPELGLASAGLAPLEREDIEAALGAKGLLLPRNETVTRLLRTPLILSIYIRASEAGKQLDVGSEKELMGAYLQALLQKELGQLPENAPERWQLDAALNFVLPCAAAEESRRGGALTEQQLLKVVEGCWRVLRSRMGRRAFPRWIGRSGDIFDGAKTPEEWYGLVIHRLLWQRLGLLMKEPDGGYRIYHQVVREYLAGLECCRIPEKRKKRRAALAAAAVTALCLLAALVPFEPAVEDAVVEKAIDYSTAGYAAYGYQYERLRLLTDYALAGDGAQFTACFDKIAGEVAAEAEVTDTEQLYLTYIRGQILDRDVDSVPWSGKRFDGELALELASYASERSAYYSELLPVIAFWMESEQARTDSPELLERFSRVLEADADVAAELYHQTCAVHLEGGSQIWRENISRLVAGIGEQESHRNLNALEDRTQYLENLRSALRQAEQELARVKAGVEYEMGT